MVTLYYVSNKFMAVCFCTLNSKISSALRMVLKKQLTRKSQIINGFSHVVTLKNSVVESATATPELSCWNKLYQRMQMHNDSSASYLVYCSNFWRCSPVPSAKSCPIMARHANKDLWSIWLRWEINPLFEIWIELFGISYRKYNIQ